MKRVFKMESINYKEIDDIKKERLYNLDLLKAIAIICVIFIHNFYLNFNFFKNNSLSVYLNYVIKMLINLGVPIFMMVNGYLLFMKSLDLKKHYKKTLKIFVIFIIWMFIMNLIINKIDGKKIDGVEGFIKDVLQSVEIGGTTGYLWFLYALIQVYLLFPLFKITYDNNKRAFYIVFIVIVFFTVLLATFGMVLSLIENSFKINNLKNIVISFVNKFNITGNWGYYTCFFLTGAVLYDYRKNISSKNIKIIAWISFFVSIIILVVYSIIQSKITNKMLDFNPYNSIFAEIIIISIFIITNDVKNENRFYNKAIIKIGQNSLGIYLFFGIYTRVSKKMIISMGWGEYADNIIVNILIVLFILMISYISNAIIKKIPLLKESVKI